MAATAQALIDAGLAECIRDGQELTPEQLDMLSQPGVVRALEKLWYMPVTGQLSFFLFNCTLHRYTVNWKRFYALEHALYFAATDGHKDVVEQMAHDHPDMVCAQFSKWIDQLQAGLPFIVACRGHLDIIIYLSNFVSKRQPTSLSTANAILTMIYWAICAGGHMRQFEEMKHHIHIRQLELKQYPNFGTRAAIGGGHLEIIRALDDLDDERSDLNSLRRESIESQSSNDEQSKPTGLRPESKGTVTSDNGPDDERSRPSKYHKIIMSNRRLNLMTGARSSYPDIMDYMLKRYTELKLRTHHKVELLQEALSGGNAKIVNLVLQYTKLKFKIEYIPFVIRGENISILTRFSKQFGDQFRDYIATHQIDLIEDTDNLEVIIFLLNYGLDVETIIQSSGCRTNCGILDLAVSKLGRERVLELVDKPEPYVIAYLDDMYPN